MAKKTVEAGAEGEEVVSQEKIQTVAHEFGREDMNELKDRLNEVIEAVNNLLD